VDLRPYQLEARDRVLDELERVRATLLVLATGLGKTVVFGAVAQHFVSRGERVLVLAHRGELLEQAAATLGRFGLSVGIEQADRRAGNVGVVVASVPTMRGRRLESFAADAFGLVIVDEAHHTAARTYRDVLEHFVSARVLGVTATPDRTDGVGLAGIFETVAYRKELGAGIREGWLSPIELRSVVVDSLDLSRVRTVAGELHAGELEEELTRDRVLHEVAGPLAELSLGRQTLVFVAGVRQAHALADVLDGYGVRAAAVDGSMPREARATVLADYRAGRMQVVCNAMLLTEGFDCPETSCIGLVRPSHSRSLLVQAIGRGTRRAEGKSSCLVLDFVPGRAARLRLSSPADALAGTELPDALVARVRELSRDAPSELDALIAQARAEEEAAKAAALEGQRAKQRLVRSVDVVFAAPRLDVAQLLESVSQASAVPAPPASAAQVEALRRAGFEVPSTLTKSQASALFEVLTKRRERGLCTLKQARRLRSYGLRDDLDFDTANGLLEIIAVNGWRPPTWMLRDGRFALREEAA
jgi:superfamily II DNA or RNA helicase